MFVGLDALNPVWRQVHEVVAYCFFLKKRITSASTTTEITKTAMIVNWPPKREPLVWSGVAVPACGDGAFGVGDTTLESVGVDAMLSEGEGSGEGDAVETVWVAEADVTGVGEGATWIVGVGVGAP